MTTAEWIGAKLDQGIWYDMTAPLRARGMADTIAPALMSIRVASVFASAGPVSANVEAETSIDTACLSNHCPPIGDGLIIYFLDTSIGGVN